MGSILQDIRYAARSLWKTPLFTAGVMLTLALGIGINATMFGIVDTLFLKPPAGVGHPDGVVRISVHHSGRMGEWTGTGVSYPLFADLRDHAAGFASTSAIYARPMGMGRGTDAVQVNVMATSHQFFRLLELRPALGRFYDSTDDRAGAEPVAVLSYAFWQNHFGGDSAVIGKTLPLGHGSYRVIGVAQRDFAGVNLDPSDIYLPVVAASQGDLNTPEAITSRGWIWISVLGRLKAGTTPGAAAAAATLAIRNGAGAARWRDSNVAVLLGPIQEARGTGESDDAKVSAWIAGVALIVLLIACANIANLLLARGVSRRRELAVRASLGAGRGGLLRMLLTESAVLATGGGALAILLAVWGGGIVRQLLLPELPPNLAVVDGRVLLFTVLAVIGTVFLVGAIPAWYASRASLVEALKQGGHGSTVRGSGTRTALLIAQIALTLTLLVGAGLFVRSLRNAKSIDMGLDAPHLMSVTISQEGRDRLESNAAYFDLGNRLRQMPGVVSVAASMGTPFRWAFADDLRAAGVDSLPQSEGGGPYFQAVTPAYLSTMGTRILSGRDLTDGDRLGSERVAVIGAYFASRLWPQQSPLGRCLYIGHDATECTAIVGVAADAKRGQLTESSSFLYYIPFAQRENPEVSELFVRTRGPADGMVAAITREARRSSTLPYVTVEPFMARVTPQLWSWQLGAMAFTAFGVLALLIAATGIFAVLSYSVSQRTKEVGLRVALGAQRGDVVRLVVGQGLRAAVAGVAIGGLGAWLLAHAIASLLYKVPPSDPATLVTAPLVLLAVAALAAYLPARRASRVDPMVALRAE